MTEKTTAKKPAGKKPRKRAAKKTDLPRLARLAGEIAGYRPGNMANLIHRLETEENLKLSQLKDGSMQADMAGIKANARGGDSVALMNWASAARRACLKGGV